MFSRRELLPKGRHFLCVLKLPTEKVRNRSGSCVRSDDDYNTIKFTKIHYKRGEQHIRSSEVASLLLLTKEHICTYEDES